MKTKMIKLFGLALIAVQLSGCGNASNVTDNLEILNSTTIPVLNSFSASSLYNTAGVPFSASNPYILFTTGWTTFISPARGVVTEVGISNVAAASGYYVTIVHSGRLASRIYGVQSPTVRLGDVVQQGTLISSFNSSSNVALQVLLDGTPICPVSFMAPSVRSVIFTNPCQ